MAKTGFEICSHTSSQSVKPKRPAKARPQDPRRHAVDRDQHRKGIEREGAAVVQIKADQARVRARAAAQPVVAAEDRRLEDIGIGHLPEGQRRHDEVDAVTAGADRADHPARNAGQGHGGGHRGCGRQAEGGRQQGVCIGPHPNQRPVAERDHAAEPRHDVERQHDDAEHDDLGQDVEAEVGGGDGGEQGGGEQG